MMPSSTHRLLYRQDVPRSRDEVFAFFSNSRNLKILTPPSVRLEMLTPEPIDMKVGTVIDYRLRMMGLSMCWRTLICEWNPPHHFVDEQVRGPYRFWRHTHRLWERGKPCRLACLQFLVNRALQLWQHLSMQESHSALPTDHRANPSLKDHQPLVVLT